MRYITTDTKLVVKGKTWGGCDGTTEYPVGNNGRTIPSTLAQAQLLSGDFEYLTEARIVRTTKRITEITKKLR